MADKSDYEKMDDGDIIKAVEVNIKSSVGYYDSQLSKERKRVTEYYNGTLPRPAHDGNSRYVSQDVYDSVEALKSALLETFSAGNKIIRFAPQNADDVKMSEVCSEYTDYVMFRQNDFYNVMSTVIHDGLTSRVGIAKVYWDEREDIEPKEFTNLTQDELDMILAEDGMEVGETTTDRIGLISGTLFQSRDVSQVAIEAIAPEEFIIEPQAKDLETTNFSAHRTMKTLTEIRAMGYPEDKIKDIGNSEDIEYETDPEVLARFESIGSDRGFNAHGYQDQVRSIMCYECYIMLDIDGTGEAKLHKVIKAGNTLLDIEEVQRRPFITFSPLPIPHSFYGSNFAEKIVATQNARTILTRSILDHATITNNPRYMVVKGSLTNPREIIDNRVGGLINTTRPDAIQPMPQASLNPFIFQTLQLLDEDKEQFTGVSKLSQGLSKDAISKQNSQAMVEQLATMSQQRQKIIARNFANQFIKPLFHEVYRLCVENEDYNKVVELAGDFVEINPSQWEDKRDVTIELKLGYSEQERESQKYLQLHTLFSQDPSIQPMYQMENRYALLKQSLENQGIKNVEEYLTPPEKLPEPQPDPAQQMQMQMAQKQIELQERQAQLAEMKAQMDGQFQQMKLELEKMKAQSDHALKADKQTLNEEQLEHKQQIDRAELDILKKTDDVRGIASPRG